MTDPTKNTFQNSMSLYMGGTDGTTLGSGMTGSSLQSTTSDRWKIGFQDVADKRGIDMGATVGVSNSAFLDFNSLDDVENDWDTRLLSVGGATGIDGAGILQIYANRFDLVGPSSNPKPSLNMGGDIYHTVVPFTAGKGREALTQQITWCGGGGQDSTNPVITIPLLGGTDGTTPLWGAFNVYLSSGYAGTGDVAIRTGWIIAKNATPATDILEGSNAAAGTALAVLYSEADWNAGGYGQIKLFNKQAGSTFKYLITGYVFPNDDMF